MLEVRECVQVDDGRRDRCRDVCGARVVRDEHRRDRDQGRELRKRELPGERDADAARTPTNDLHELDLAAVARVDDRPSGPPMEFGHDGSESVRRVAPGRSRRARMNREPRSVGTDPQSREAFPNRSACHVRDVQRQVLVGGVDSDRGQQVELSPDLVPDRAVGLRIRDPVRQQRVRVLAAVGDSGEPAEDRRRQGTLGVDGEDDRAVVTARSQPLDHFEIGRRDRVVGFRFHPRRLIDDDLVNLWEELGGGAPAP